jgi:hypothetical protein
MANAFSRQQASLLECIEQLHRTWDLNSQTLVRLVHILFPIFKIGVPHELWGAMLRYFREDLRASEPLLVATMDEMANINSEYMSEMRDPELGASYATDLGISCFKGRDGWEAYWERLLEKVPTVFTPLTMMALTGSMINTITKHE